MFYERLKSACKNANTTVTATLKAIGIGTANGTYWKNGSIPSSDVVVKLAEFLKISTDYLLLGKEQNIITDDTRELITNYNAVDIVAKAMIRERAKTLAELAAERAAQEAEKVSKEKKKNVEAKTITIAPTTDEAPEQDEDEPLIKIRHSVYKVSAGCGFESDEGDNWETIEILDTPEARRADYALTISGESMEPVYYDGDIVLVKMQDTVEMGQIGIFILDGSGYIKKYCGDHLVSLNEVYDDILFSDYENIKCSGRVIGRV